MYYKRIAVQNVMSGLYSGESTVFRYRLESKMKTCIWICMYCNKFYLPKPSKDPYNFCVITLFCFEPEKLNFFLLIFVYYKWSNDVVNSDVNSECFAYKNLLA